MRRARPVLLRGGQAARQARPAWKVFKVIGDMLGLTASRLTASGCAQASGADGSVDQSKLGNAVQGVEVKLGARQQSWSALLAMPIYFADPIARRSARCNRLPDAAEPQAPGLKATLAQIGVDAGARVKGHCCRRRRGSHSGRGWWCCRRFA